ncbi:MAG TPA: periplasmic heavy metal sensor [Candidatus Angelobacter sp.]|nr:periplasmic heavy metal sensor [Candidatus Angelobacter sp.]
MKRGVAILFIGLALGLCAYCGFYFAGTAAHRTMLESDTPELAWLKREFDLNETEFARVVQLHDAYKSECMTMCRRIDAKNAELKKLLTRSDTLTPEIEAKLAEAGQLRVECQKNMLRHFLEVSRTMPPEQGRRYLAWVQEKTFLPEHKMHNQGSAAVSSDEHGHQ